MIETLTNNHLWLVLAAAVGLSLLAVAIWIVLAFTFGYAKWGDRP